MFPPKTKVLVVDDMMTMRKIVKNCLRKLGMDDLTEAVNGKDAWEKLTSASPPFDLIISDWNMPEMTGVEFLKSVRASKEHSQMPFILLTAEGEAHQIQEAIQSGVDAYIMKPFQAQTITEKLGAVYKKWSHRMSAGVKQAG